MISVYYPHYACHALGLSLQNYSRIYLSLSPGQKGDPGGRVAGPVSDMMPGN